MLRQYREKLHPKSLQVRLLVYVVFIAYASKLFLQALSVFEPLQELAFHNRYVVISYIHLVLIGTITLFIIGYFMSNNWWKESRFTSVGTLLFLVSFVVCQLSILALAFGVNTDLLKATMLSSFAMALGILFIILSLLSSVIRK